MDRQSINRIVFKSVSMTILLGGAFVAMAQSGTDIDDERGKHRGRGMHHDGMGRGMPDPARIAEKMQRYLDLDDTQSQQLMNTMEAGKPELEALRNGIRENRKAMRGLDANDPDYSVTMQNLAAVSADLASQMTLLHGKLRAEINAILTPEQRQLLAERGDKRRGRHRGNSETAE